MNSTIKENTVDVKSLLANVLKSRSADFKKFFSKGNNKEIEILINNIQFIEAKGELSVLHMDDQVEKSPIVAMSIGQCEDMLKNFAFLRVHRSFVVNCTFIKNIQLIPEAQIHLVTGEVIPISRRRRESIIKYMIDVGFSNLLEA